MAKKILTVFVLCALVFAAGCAEKPRNERGGIRVWVTEGMTGAPLEGARVTVPETGLSLLTGADGLAVFDALPVIPDSVYDQLLPCPCGRVTLLVTAEGFTPYLLLYARVFPNETRDAGVLMFPDDGTLKTFTVIEAPPAEWCDALAEKYGKPLSTDH